MARRLAALAGSVAALAARAHAVTYAATAVTQYSIQTPDIGGCRLKGIATDSDNFKFYASLPAKDVAINQGCARCIKVSRDGVAASLTAYVLDVCQGCKTGEIKLSAAALSALSIDPNSNNATASYKFASCPTSFQSGTTVRACLMEGASNSYIPLQFYNSQKVIVGANISGVAASQQKDSFFFSANPQTASSNSSQWFKNVQVTLTSDDGETKSGSFEFGGTSGCAASTFQFSAASTADGEGGNSSGGSGGGSSSSNTGVIVGAIAGGIAALIVIVGSVFFLRRRRAAKEFDREEEQDNQYLSPTTKPHQRSPERPTYAADNSLHNSTDDPSDHEPESPTHEFDDASTPPASAANRNVYGAREVEQYELRDVPPQPPQRSQSPPQRSQSPPQRSQSPPQRSQSPPQPQSVAPPAANQQTYMAPQTFSYSKPVTNERLPKNNSFRTNSTARPVPTFQAPVVPARTADSDGEEGRSSFDIDDMRETEEMKDRERFSSMSNELQSSVAPHSSESAYATGHVTSPQSYVRATSLRRNSSKVADRPTFRFTSPAPAPQQQDRYNSDSLGQYSDRDSYASDNFSRSESIDTAANVNPHTGSFRDSSSGYSRESLGILGYPYAKKPSSRNSMTEAQL